MYSLGYDLGSSSLKISIVDAQYHNEVSTIKEPTTAFSIESEHPHWAEQNPELWWDYLCLGTKKILKQNDIDATEICSIGISYQMHGLVMIDARGKPLGNAIIWCDSRAIQTGIEIENLLPPQYCSHSLLNSPGNFTFSKLKWVKDYQPEIYEKIHHFLLPGDYLSFKLTSNINTTVNGLTEGILWDYPNHQLAHALFDRFEMDAGLCPEIVANFDSQGYITKKAAQETGLSAGIPIRYRSGDQPNNAFSLGVFDGGEIAATCGSSGVFYAIEDCLKAKKGYGFNYFAHVNHQKNHPRIGKLLCINGAGYAYQWLKEISNQKDFRHLNQLAEKVPIGSDGLISLTFGNGAERVLGNKNLGASFLNLNYNRHHLGHLARATIEGIAFAFVYGYELLDKNKGEIKTLRAGSDNLFQSKIFSNTLCTLIQYPIEVINTTGAIGAARASLLKMGALHDIKKMLHVNDRFKRYHPDSKKHEQYLKAYQKWKEQLLQQCH